MQKDGILVRVTPEIEELVREVANILEYQPHSIRNTAILLGLLSITTSKRIPDSDKEFIELLEITKEAVRRMRKYA